MNATVNLPYDFCDTCSMFRLDVSKNDLMVDDKTIHAIEIRCENRFLCKELKKNLDRQKGANETV